MPLAVVATSRKAGEKRVPLHPEQLRRLPAALRRELVFETGYGEAFGWSDARLGELVGGLASRAELMGLEAVLLPYLPAVLAGRCVGC